MPDDREASPRASRIARWAAEQGSAPPPAAWLFGEPNDQARELAELRERLAEAEQRAEDAEAALPHLLALGQRTVNSLLSDARARGRQIIDEARADAALVIDEERKALDREAAELDALRMAVACEAMGLEHVRAELMAAAAALELAGGDPATVLSARELPAPRAEPVAESVAEVAADPVLLPPPPPQADLASVGMGQAPASVDTPSSRFADAWAQGEDEMMAEAFDRFFAGVIDDDPLRDSVVAADDAGDAVTDDGPEHDAP